MLELHIEDKIYLVPPTIKLGDYCDLLVYDPLVKHNWVSIVSRGLDVPLEDVMLLPEETLELGVSMVVMMMYPLEYQMIKPFDVSNITFGKFINLEILINRGWKKNLRGLLNELFDKEITDETPVEEWYGGLMYYFNFRENILKTYSKLFGSDEEDIDPSTKTGFVNNDPSHLWYELVVLLAGEEFLKLDDVVNKPLKAALNFLSFKKDKIKKENKILKDELQRVNRRGKRGY